MGRAMMLETKEVKIWVTLVRNQIVIQPRRAFKAEGLVVAVAWRCH